MVDGQTSEAHAAFDSAIKWATTDSLEVLGRDLDAAVSKHGALAGAEDVRKRIEARAAKLQESLEPQSVE